MSWAYAKHAVSAMLYTAECCALQSVSMTSLMLVLTPAATATCQSARRLTGSLGQPVQVSVQLAVNHSLDCSSAAWLQCLALLYTSRTKGTMSSAADMHT